jgi:tetratricopeptide (TPR) repeat protein
MNNFSKILPIYILIFILLTIENVTFSQDIFPRLDQVKSFQRDTSSYYFREIWMKSIDISDNDLTGYLRRASSKLERGFLKEALQDINKAIGIDSAFGESYSLKGYILLKSDSLKSSLFNFKKSIVLNDNNIYNNYYCAEIYSLVGNFDEAENYYKKAIKLDKKFPGAYFGLANVQRSKYFFPTIETENLYKKVIELNPSFYLAYFNIGLMYITSNQNKALKYLDKTIELDSTFAYAYYVRGYLEKALNNLSETHKDWNKAIELEPKNNTYRISLAFLDIAEKNYTIGFNEILKAIDNVGLKNFFTYFETSSTQKILNDFLSQAITFNKYPGEIRPEDKDKIIKALCYFLQGKFNDAEDIYSTLVNNDSIQSIVYYLRGYNFEYLHKADQSIESYSASLKHTNFPSESYLRKGIVLNIQGNLQEAIKNMKLYISINDSVRLAHRSLASAYINSLKYDSAIIEFNKLVMSDSTEAEVYYYRGICFKKLEKYKEAISDFNRFIIGNPFHLVTTYTSAGLKYSLGDTTRASSMPIPTPFQLESIFNVADCEYSLGDTIGAYSTLNQAYDKVHFLTKEGFFLRGSINLVYKKYDLAINDFTAVINWDPKNTDSYTYRGLCYYCKGDLKLAKTDLTSAIQINSNEITAFYTRGLVNVKQGKLKEAYEDLTRAESLGHPLARRAIQVYLNDFEFPDNKSKDKKLQ